MTKEPVCAHGRWASKCEVCQLIEAERRIAELEKEARDGWQAANECRRNNEDLRSECDQQAAAAKACSKAMSEAQEREDAAQAKAKELEADLKRMTEMHDVAARMRDGAVKLVESAEAKVTELEAKLAEIETWADTASKAMKAARPSDADSTRRTKQPKEQESAGE